MRVRVFVVGFVVALVLILALVTQARGGETPESGELLVTPTATVPTHMPYDPFRPLETLPEYPGEPRSRGLRSRAVLTKPTGIDLDVTYINRTPMHNRYEVWYTADGKPYLRPGTESDKRWPDYGEIVTFTAHIINKGTTASGVFAFKWFIDDVEVFSGTHSSLAPEEEGTVSHQWIWEHTVDNERLLGRHTLGFEVDPGDAITETYESNNFLEDRTDSVSLVLALTPELYEALETPVDDKWPHSAEDWLQKQIAAMNEAFTRSIYPSVPDGIQERVRLDNILVTSSAPPTDWSEDGGFFMSGDDRFGNAYYDPLTDVSGALIHELTHQLGIIDLYNLNVPLELPQVLDRNGRPVQMEFQPSYPGLMSNPGIRPAIYAEHTALGLDTNKGYRRGYYGEYLYDVPTQAHVRVLDNQGNPASGVLVSLYQRASSPNMLGSLHGVIDNTPEISVETDDSGLALLPNRPVGDPVSTHTGHALTDNPLGVIDIVGRNDEFLVELSKGAHQEYLWLDITQFNLTAWRGETTLEISSRVPPDDAPAPPARLSGTLAYGQVKLQWQPSPSSTVASYNVYRTSGPARIYKRLITGTTALSCTVPYDYDASAVGYAVTAVDDSGYESGFSDLFWALRLSNPASVALDANDQRIILDPQNGYALLLQSPDDVYLDTIGSYDLHLEDSQYMVRDPAGRLIISHPGDWYSSRHSVRVTDQDANLLFEFGERGLGPGQFETPTGVATWEDPCTYGGPYPVDAHTLLLLHFDDSYAGAQGEPGTPDGTTFVSGQYGQGVLVDAVDRLTYAAAGNIEREQGAVEFWISPHWDGGDGQNYTLFEVGDAWFNRLRIMKDGANNLRFILWDSTIEYGVAYNVAHWQAEEWHHVAATWEGASIALYVDGEQRAGSGSANPPDTLATTIYVGSSVWHDQQADAVIDELRISDIPRIGNSDTCAYRILVADSGNHRLQVFDGEGNYISAHGDYGSDSDEFNNPQGLAIDSSGHVIVADPGNNRLQVLSFDGVDLSFIRSITAGLDGPTGLATYGSNRIIVADTGSNNVKVLDAQGNLLGEYDAPNDGRTGMFSQPRGVAADSSARIVVADTGNRRVVTILNALPAWPPTSVAIAGPTAGTVEADCVFKASVGPVTTTRPVTYTWQTTGISSEMHTDRGLSDIISFTWNTTGTKAITVTVTNGGGTVSNTHAITISEPHVPVTSITKTVTPQGTVKHGDELTYTLVISAAPGIWLNLYDPLEGTTFQRFVERPPGMSHADGVISGTVYLGGFITGTLEVTPTNQVTVSFVTRVGIPGTVGLTANVRNRACMYSYGETLSGCIWSNEVTNQAFRAYDFYLPLMMRELPRDFGEPNDTPEQAFGPLTSGQVYWAFIWDETDADDYYHFTSTTTDKVTVEVTNIPEGRDYDLSVYNYDGGYNLIAISQRPGNADEDTAFAPIAGETYYVRVRPYSGFSSVEPYHLKITYQ